MKVFAGSMVLISIIPFESVAGENQVQCVSWSVTVGEGARGTTGVDSGISEMLWSGLLHPDLYPQHFPHQVL